MIQDIEQSNRLLNTVNSISAIMLQAGIDTFEHDLYRAMRLMAEATGVDRVYIWKNYSKAGKLYCTQLYEWPEGTGSRQQSGTARETSYSDIIPNWEKQLSQGHCVTGIVRTMPVTGQAVLSPRGILSILVVPVFVRDAFWGFVGFDACRHERIFHKSEEMILRSASNLIANAIICNEAASKAREAETRTKMMLDSMPWSCQLWDRNIDIIDCNEAAVKLHGFKDKYEFMERFFECSPEYQNDGQRSDIRIRVMVQKAFEEGSCLFEWMHQTPDGTPIPAEVTLIRVRFGGGFVVIGYVRDMRNIRDMEKNIQQLETEVSENEALTKAVVEGSPLAYIMCDENLQPVDCNNEAVRLFACPDKRYFVDNYWKRLMPKLQVDGQKSLEKARALTENTFLGRRKVFEWHYISFYGVSFPTETSVMHLMYKGKKFVIAFMYDLRNIKKMEKNIQWLKTEVDKAYYDPLTNIHNRRFFNENLQHVLRTLSRSGGTLSLMMIDIDYFKKYNDTYGHVAGDNSLRRIAETLANTATRNDDFVARYGGEEFVVVLPNTDGEGARLIANRMLENIRACNIPHEKSDAANYITISIGVTSGTVEYTHSADDYIMRADEMLYQSKQGGRNQYAFGYVL